MFEQPPPGGERREGTMISIFWAFVIGIVALYAGAFLMLVVMGLCNAAAEGDRQAEQAAAKAKAARG